MDFLYIYDGDMMLTPATANIKGVTGYFNESLISVSNALTLTFVSSPKGAGSGFNISINTGMI